MWYPASVPSFVQAMVVAAAVLAPLVVIYAVLGFVRPTSWAMDATGLTLRSTVVLGARVRIPWTDVVSLTLGTKLVYRTNLQSLNLDGRIVWSRHVTMIRRGAARAVQFTPQDIEGFEQQLPLVLGQLGWSRLETGWQQDPQPPVTGRH
jgi:hypothetical protein